MCVLAEECDNGARHEHGEPPYKRDATLSIALAPFKPAPPFPIHLGEKPFIIAVVGFSEIEVRSAESAEHGVEFFVLTLIADRYACIAAVLTFVPSTGLYRSVRLMLMTWHDVVS